MTAVLPVGSESQSGEGTVLSPPRQVNRLVDTYLPCGLASQPLKAWLTEHSAAMMTIILLLIGVVLLGKGIESLS